MIFAIIEHLRISLAPKISSKIITSAFVFPVIAAFEIQYVVRLVFNIKITGYQIGAIVTNNVLNLFNPLERQLVLV